MKLMYRAAMLAAPLCLAFSAPAMAQSDPFVGGEFVEVTGVSVDDGHYLDYANFLSGFYKAQEEYAVSQGWELSWEILANVHKRKGEPDLYLIRRYKDVVNGAEADRRDAADVVVGGRALIGRPLGRMGWPWPARIGRNGKSATSNRARILVTTSSGLSSPALHGSTTGADSFTAAMTLPPPPSN